MIEVATWLDPKIVNGGVHPKTCGQFVDRILSTVQIAAGSGWERTGKP